LEEPREIRIATNMLWASLGANLLVLGLAIDEVGYGKASGGSILVVWLLLLAWPGVLSFLFYSISVGRNWARITFGVLFLLGHIYQFALLPDLFRTQGVVRGLLVLIEPVLQIAALYLVFSRPGAQWFRR